MTSVVASPKRVRPSGGGTGHMRCCSGVPLHASACHRYGLVHNSMLVHRRWQPCQCMRLKQR